MLYRPSLISAPFASTPAARAALTAPVASAAAPIRSRRLISFPSLCIALSCLSHASNRVFLPVGRIDVLIGAFGIGDAFGRGVPLVALPGHVLRKAAQQKRFRHRGLCLETGQGRRAALARGDELLHRGVV